ncbi:trihelix transcription factor GTL1-like isoform X2 [Cucumis melo]|uniref:Trihelix transcription factor GTL1-like isoform X2 n=1 Tax=Cucumis melo TaxID=3656 RepID=A0ABM3L788_CUCME|nr:trihelix transcription factor GTL1-like isoform X2 [Cucumis melo]
MEPPAPGSGLPDPSQLFRVVSTPPPPPSLTVDTTISDSQQVEAASPISSRPPAVPSSYEELIRLGGGGGAGHMVVDDDEADGRSGGGSGGSGGNRWPRQETLALLKIRSEMDSVFRDATLKGPLWDEVSRKLEEMGYKRNAKKCKEKFENVQKYYKRTKEGRGGRQDGKTYKFFTQLEALHNANVAPSSSNSSFTLPQPLPAAATTTTPVGFGISNPTPISSVKISSSSSQTPMGIFSTPSDHFTVRPPPAVAAPMGVSFSSNTSSASTEDDDDDDEDEEMGFDVDLEGEPENVAGSSRKRRRGVVKGNNDEWRSSSSSSDHKMMMEFFEGLMKQVMEKQEVMQQKFLEAIEKREQDRMVREENWKKEEMFRLSQEQERMAQERTISASRDAAIIAFLQKFTGQTIQFSAPATAPQVPVPVPMAVSVPMPMPVPAPLSPVSSHQPMQPQTLPHLQNQPPTNTIPLEQPKPKLQEIIQGGDGSSEPISSRWPKQEVLALIKLRGGLESKYQETGPKGPLWEEISAGMIKMGYKRSAKRCKEKWENINKYFKKVKESNKKRREDSKTCPYFNELDALYRKKILSTAAATATASDHSGSFEQNPIQNMEIIPPSTTTTTTDHHLQSQPHSSSIPQGLSATLFGEGTEEQQQQPTSTKKTL